ncbi:SOS response-associated peptidase family protein [Chelatococcus reniformis]|uniref:DUF3606 domain-containing protein n=1 Tax=Chelatococcus reniformis TaxID=1494448 RepID=A0A916UQ81_9HYPH|nr:SOS response-associated peptidase family protein [Chelatococcus reniformis]GGC82979.1 hypothetical protein GCM10010994_46080 [Chelatococcus reniformis]
MGNLPPQPGIYPDYTAPIVRTAADGVRELVFARWGLPSPRKVVEEAAEKRAAKLLPRLPRSTWRRWSGASRMRASPTSAMHRARIAAAGSGRGRCLLSFTSFAEPEPLPAGSRPPAWFAFNEDRPLAVFAGLHVPGWTSVRKAKEGEVIADLYAFLTTSPDVEVGAIHPKTMPVILTTPEECETRFAAPAPIALELQRPTPDGGLQIVARGENEGRRRLSRAPFGPDRDLGRCFLRDEGTHMSDDETNVGARCQARAASGRNSEVADFAQLHGLTRKQVYDLIDKYGNDREKLEAAAHELKSAGPGP